jgi:hypothetical protein
VRDHRVGGIEDVGAGTVVLFQLERDSTGVVAQEALHVLDLGAAPAVDRLVVVADHEHLPGLAGEQAHEAVLDGVGVLELVDQHLAEAMAVMRQQRRGVAQHFMRAQQQFGEIDQPARSQRAWYSV